MNIILNAVGLLYFVHAVLQSNVSNDNYVYIVLLTKIRIALSVK